MAVSMALQSGVPIKVLCDKFVHVRFEPSGYTNHPEIRIAKSVMDYIFRWLGLKFLGPEYGKTGGGGGGRTDPDRARAEVAVPGVVEGGSTGKSGPSVNHCHAESWLRRRGDDVVYLRDQALQKLPRET